MVTYSICFSVEEKPAYWRYGIILDANTNAKAKKSFVEFCKQNPNGYNNSPYTEKPTLVKKEILAGS